MNAYVHIVIFVCRGAWTEQKKYFDCLTQLVLISMNAYVHIVVFMCFGALKGKKKHIILGVVCLDVADVFIETNAQGEKILGLLC